ncbi:hypothetical protein HMPREF1869_01001 [Bacteroidales bacterium KA00251]|nr:hypothetical protein HMPREF1869_01001 [Bacteroidales bacterium KA00251]
MRQSRIPKATQRFAFMQQSSLTEVTRRIKAHCDKIRIFAHSSQ